jgi:putative nucleotidyltransferase with HDIG domain
MPKKLKFYFVLVVLGAGVFCLFLDWTPLVGLSTRELFGLATFLGLAGLSQGLAVESAVGTSKPVQSSIAFLPLLALAMVMPVSAVVLSVGAMTVIVALATRQGDWPRVAFNTAQTMLAYGMGALVFRQLGRLLGTPVEFTGAVDIANLFLPLYGLAFTFFGLNLFFVSVGLALRESENFVAVLREVAGRGGGNLLYDLLASPLALFAAYLYEAFYIGGLLAIVLPLLLIRHSYLSEIQLQQANRDLLKVLVKAIETRDPYTSGHSQRVSKLAKMMAEDYGLRSKTVNDVEHAALLHDIGKIEALYAEIISKAGKLTDAERKVIRTHATKGADLLQTLTSMEKTVIAGVRHHHERYDGSGYPDGLKGKEIPIAARIIMLCDSIDAMLSDRPYRKALPLSHVRDELKRCSGTQFDPDIVQAIFDHNTLERADLLVDRAGARTAVHAVAG